MWGLSISLSLSICLSVFCLFLFSLSLPHLPLASSSFCSFLSLFSSFPSSYSSSSSSAPPPPPPLYFLPFPPFPSSWSFSPFPTLLALQPVLVLPTRTGSTDPLREEELTDVVVGDGHPTSASTIPVVNSTMPGKWMEPTAACRNVFAICSHNNACLCFCFTLFFMSVLSFEDQSL